MRVVDLCAPQLCSPGPALRLLHGAPAALQRPVTGTTTIDLREPGRYVAVGHLVLTGLAWRRDASDSDAFAASVEAAGGCALAVGEGLLGEVPDDVVAAARRVGLPVLAVPADVPFHRVSAAVDAALGPREDTVGRLLAVAAAGGSLADVVAGLPGVQVLSATGRRLAGEGPEDVDALFAGGAPGRRVGEGPAPWWLVARDVPEAHLVALAGIAALHRRLPGPPVPAPTGEVVALAVDTAGLPLVLDAVADRPHEVAGDGALGDVVLVDAGAAAEVRHRLERTAGFLTEDLVVGASRRGTERADAVEGARRALAAGRTRSGRVVVERELDTGGVADLLRLVPAAERQRFARRVLDGVLQDADLLLTLRTHLRTGASPARTAAALHVHQNTVRHRLSRVESLLDRDLRDVEDLVDLQVALSVLDPRVLGHGQ